MHNVPAWRMLTALTLTTLLYASSLLPVSIAQQPPVLPEMFVARSWDPETVDPHLAYEIACGELIFNVYETLVFYDGESVDKFVPQLAEDWWISQDGLTYVFKIRNGVKFHNGETLSTGDVEYSFERLMVRDFSNGPGWMIFEPLLNVLRANLSDPSFGAKIDNAVQSNATHVWFNLAKPYAPFLTILSQHLSSILSKKFLVSHGDWPQTWNNWTLYHDPKVSPLDYPVPLMCGTGPFKFDYWIKFVSWSMVRFDDYWGGWPARRPVLNGISPQGYLERVTFKIEDWAKRYEGFLNGRYDTIEVPTWYISTVEGLPGIRCFKDLPIIIGVHAMCFTFNISLLDPWGSTNELIGLPPHEPGAIHESGIPVDFFSDINVRKAFAHSFNYTAYIQDPYQLRGEAVQPASPIVQGLPYHNPMQEKYELNLTKAEEHFRQAWGGRVWQEGFTFTIMIRADAFPPIGWWPYVLKQNLEGLNPKFHINVVYRSLPIYHYYTSASCNPLFLVRWNANYPEPHDIVQEFMHSKDDLAGWQRYRNASVDALIEEGLRELDPAKRQEIYYELQRLYHEDVPSVPTAQLLDRHWERDWVRGWYYNPAYLANLYFYPMWKETTPVVTADIDVEPDTLNLRSEGREITAYLEFPEGWSPTEVDVSSIKLNGTISVDPLAPAEIGDFDKDSRPDLMVKFKRSEVSSLILEAAGIANLVEERYKEVTLTATGKFKNGTWFQGSTTVKVTLSKSP